MKPSVAACYAAIRGLRRLGRNPMDYDVESLAVSIKDNRPRTMTAFARIADDHYAPRKKHG